MVVIEHALRHLATLLMLVFFPLPFTIISISTLKSDLSFSAKRNASYVLDSLWLFLNKWKLSYLSTFVEFVYFENLEIAEYNLPLSIDL